MGITKSGSYGVFHVFFIRCPFQIPNSVVLLVPVNMIYAMLAFGIWNKRFRNKGMNHAPIIAAEFNYHISKMMAYWF